MKLPRNTHRRLAALDGLRVFSIVMMIAYHFIYDLKYFEYVDWNTPLGDGFRQWRTSIVFGFVLAMGLSMGIAHGHGRNHRAFKKRILQISGCALLISVVSLFMFPESYIYFGILHFMVIASLLTFILVERPRLALLAGVVVLISFWAGFVPYAWPFNLIPDLPGYTEDFVSPFPWLGVALIGLFLGVTLVKNDEAMERWSNVHLGGSVGKIVGFAGKRSLSIYMLHQPVLFSLIIATGFLIRLFAA